MSNTAGCVGSCRSARASASRRDAGGRPNKRSQAQSKQPQSCNVLLLTIDALRSDMPWVGYEREIAPHLTALAKQSVVWTQYRSVSSYTAQSVATLLSGRYASTLYRNGWFFTEFNESNYFFPELLQEKGVRTMAVHAHMYFSREKDKGLDQGFDEWVLTDGIEFDSQTDNHVTSPKSAQRIIELLSNEENTRGQFFLWSHFMDPHDKYIQHEESPDFGRFNRDRYDSEVFFTDMWLGKVLDFAREQPWWARTCVIITGDHGEAFGEHGMFKHAFELWEPVVRVPLIIYAPGVEPKRIDVPRSHIDIAPTIAELMGQPALPGFQGESLVPEMRTGAAKARPVLLELAEDSHNPARKALVDGRYKLITFGPLGVKRRLYDIQADPGEKKDLTQARPELFADMGKKLDTAFAELGRIRPYGNMKLRSGSRARGPEGPKQESKKQDKTK